MIKPLAIALRKVIQEISKLIKVEQKCMVTVIAVLGIVTGAHELILITSRIL